MPKFCKQCGSALSESAKFCKGCGAPTTAAQQEPAQEVVPVSVSGVVKQTLPPVPQPQPPKKMSTGLMVGIIAAVVIVVLGIVGVGGFFAVRALGRKINPTSASLKTPEKTTAPEESSQTSYEDYRGYEDGDTPSVGDFFWFTEDAQQNGLPADSTPITDFNAISGYWKAYEETIPTLSDEGRYLMWFSAEISGSANKALFTYHAENAVAFDEEAQRDVDLSQWKGNSYKGSFSDGRFVAGDVATKGIEIVISRFYTAGGKQYAIGEEHWISGEASHLVLVRP